jgi:hypothetical protein
MKLAFFTGKNGHRLCPTSEGLIVAHQDLTDEQIAKALEAGEGRMVEGEYNGKPSRSILVGFDNGNTTEIEVKALRARKATPVAAVTLEFVD